MSVRDYIAFRYPNWLDYAGYMARANGFESWAADLLGDVIADLLGKPEAQLIEMYERKTRKIVNGKPTTELDKFVLAMMHRNATSRVAPFRKNTLGQKILSRAGKHVEVAHSVEFGSRDMEDEDYNPATADRLDAMHAANLRRLGLNGFNSEAAEVYMAHYVLGGSLAGFSDEKQREIGIITDFLKQPKTLLDEDE